MNTATDTQKQNLLDALSHFTTAWEELVKAWHKTDFTLETYYPFSESFDDLSIQVKEWEDASRSEIEEDAAMEGWTLTDDSTKQYGKRLNDHTFLFKETGKPETEIDLSLYSDELIQETISAYGYTMGDAHDGRQELDDFANPKWIMAECLFEMDVKPDKTTEITPPGLPSGIPSGSVEVYADDLTGKARELAAEFEQKLYEGNSDSNEQFAFVIKMAMEGYFVTLCSDGAIDCLYKLPPPTPIPTVSREAKKYLVCWVTKKTIPTNKDGDRYSFKDEYAAFHEKDSVNNLKEAKEFYASLLEDEELYTANLTEILESTDY